MGSHSVYQLLVGTNDHSPLAEGRPDRRVLILVREKESAMKVGFFIVSGILGVLILFFLGWGVYSHFDRLDRIEQKLEPIADIRNTTDKTYLDLDTDRKVGDLRERANSDFRVETKTSFDKLSDGQKGLLEGQKEILAVQKETKTTLDLVDGRVRRSQKEIETSRRNIEAALREYYRRHEEKMAKRSSPTVVTRHIIVGR